MADDENFLDDLTQRLRCQEAPAFPRDDIYKRIIDKRRIRPNRLLNGFAIRPYQIAAAIVGVMIASGVIWSIGPFADDSSFAMEQVVNAVEQSSSVRYTCTTYGRPDPYIGKYSLSTPGCLRIEVGERVLITNANQGRFTQILPSEKKVVVRPLYPSSTDVSPVDEFLQQLRDFSNGTENRSYKRDQDGRDIVEFQRSFGGDNWTVVVDANTKLPVRMEISRGMVGGKEIREVISDFVFDAPMDESLFEAAVPKGFSVEERVADRTNKSYPAGDAQTLVVAPGQLGPVTSGMTSDEIIGVLGKPDWITKSGIPTVPAREPKVTEREKGAVEILEYDSRGFTITLGPGKQFAVSCYGQLSSGQVVRDFVGRTNKGIKLGASRDEVVDAYGKPEIERGDSLEYLELGWHFQFREKKLCRFEIRPPMPKRKAGGGQIRVLKDGSILETAPGVDINSLLDSDGNLKKSKN